MLTEAVIRTLSKVLLHDHLDGGLRPQTIIELARDQQYTKLPTNDTGALADGSIGAHSEAACRSFSKASCTPAA